MPEKAAITDDEIYTTLLASYQEALNEYGPYILCSIASRPDNGETTFIVTRASDKTYNKRVIIEGVDGDEELCERVLSVMQRVKNELFPPTEVVNV